MPGTNQSKPAVRETDASRRAGPPVDELIQNRREIASAGAVESPSRAAGGFPTLGGGMRVHAAVGLPEGAGSAAHGAAGSAVRDVPWSGGGV